MNTYVTKTNRLILLLGALALAFAATLYAAEEFSSSWKLAIALKLKRETSATNAWLAVPLIMGTPKGVSSFCGKYAKERQAHWDFQIA